MPKLADAQKKLMDALDRLESTLEMIPATPAPDASSAMSAAFKTEILDEMARIDATIESAMGCINRGNAASGDAE